MNKTITKMIRVNKIGQYGQKKKEEQLVRSFKTLDKIYSVLQEMDRLGYPTKINKYIINFCVNKKLWLVQLFLKESKDKKDAFSITTRWKVEPSVEETKDKLSELLSNGLKL